jgi:hypothetical protein
MNYADLLKKGFRRQPDGSYARDYVGAIPASVAKPNPPQALDGHRKGGQKDKGGVRVVVTIIAVRKRLADDDGVVSSYKSLRDCIAKELGVDDGDKRIRFEYGQVETRGQVGTLIKIEMI